MDYNTDFATARPAMKSHEYRKIVKPLLERRRRARINQCLTELKSILLETDRSIDSTEASKLEKADILELTVRHLREMRVRRSRPSTPTNPDPSRRPMINTNTNNGSSSFRVGFTECAGEVSAFVSSIPGINSAVRSRLLSHLASRVDRLQHQQPLHVIPPQQMTSAPQIHPDSRPNTPPQYYVQMTATGTGSLTPPPSPRTHAAPGLISPAPSATEGGPVYVPLSPVSSPLDLTGREDVSNYQFPSNYNCHEFQHQHRGLASAHQSQIVHAQPAASASKPVQVSHWRPW